MLEKCTENDAFYRHHYVYPIEKGGTQNTRRNDATTQKELENGSDHIPIYAKGAPIPYQKRRDYGANQL